MSGASKRADGRASGPVLMSVFLVDPDHSAWDDRYELRALVSHSGALPIVKF